MFLNSFINENIYIVIVHEQLLSGYNHSLEVISNVNHLDVGSCFTSNFKHYRM